MILYPKELYGIPLLLRIYGSALPRSQPFAIVAVLLSVFLSTFLGEAAHALKSLIQRIE